MLMFLPKGFFCSELGLVSWKKQARQILADHRRNESPKPPQQERAGSSANTLLVTLRLSVNFFMALFSKQLLRNKSVFTIPGNLKRNLFFFNYYLSSPSSTPKSHQPFGVHQIFSKSPHTSHFSCSVELAHTVLASEIAILMSWSYFMNPSVSGCSFLNFPLHSMLQAAV